MASPARLERVSAARADLVLDRPAKLNALTIAALEELARLAAGLHDDPPRVVVVRSSNARAFSVGADLAEQSALTPVGALHASERGGAALAALAAVPWPVVAAIDGHCLGGGLELALACDLRVATRRARFAFPEASLGNATGWNGIARLVSTVGPARAKDLLMTGRTLDADEALAAGLVDRLAADDGLEAATDALAATLARNAPLALHAAKRGVDALAAPPHHAGHAQALAAAFHTSTEDAQRGKGAFRTRETPTFVGR